MTAPMIRPRSTPALLTLGLLALTACAGDDGASDATATTTDATTTGELTDTTTTTTTTATTATTAAETDGTTAADAPIFQLTILHNNDGESQLIDAGSGLEDFGGAARFVTLVGQLRAAATPADTAARSYGVITLSSGDNFLAGPEFGVSLEKGAPYYDAVVLDAIGYDAICLGNHDFDFGPDTLATFIGGVDDDVPYLSANLDVTPEPMLAPLVAAGRIARSVVVAVGDHEVGVIGATTPMLPFISSPRDVIVGTMVAEAIQAEVSALEAEGVDKIILIAHLQSIEEDLALAPMLSGVDVMIAGGGDEVLADGDDVLIPGDEEGIYGPYPMMAENGVPIVTTKGNYRYVGRLIVDFDGAGEVVAIHDESGMVRVAGGGEPDAVDPDPGVQSGVIDPLVAALADLDANVIATSEVALDGKKTSVRTAETNQGDLIADALLWQAQALAAEYGAPSPLVALQNGGGIRNDTVIDAGEITELDTFDMVPFPNFVAIVEEVSPTELKALLENAVSKVEEVDGRFAQVAGLSFSYDPMAAPRTVDEMGVVIDEGARVLEVVLDDSTKIVSAGEVEPMAPTIAVATINFLANGGDQYPFGGAKFTTLGVTYQRAVLEFIKEALKGTISAALYPEGGSGRITAL